MNAGPNDEVHSKDRTWFIRGGRGCWDVYVNGARWNVIPCPTREYARTMIRNAKVILHIDNL